MTEPEADLKRLQRRLERERKARLEAEQVAESKTRELYDAVREVEEAHRYLGLLQRAAVAANEAATFEEAAAHVIADVVETTGWSVGHLYTADDTGEQMLPTTLWSLRDPEAAREFRQITEATPLANGEGLPGRVQATGRPAWIVDVTQDPNFPRARAATDIGVRAAFGFPVAAGARVVAVLEFFATEPVEPDEAMLEVMAHIGTQLAQVVERTAAQEALRTSEAHTRLIIETAGDAFIAIDADSTVLEWNQAAERIFGWSRDEILGRTLPETIIPEHQRDAHLRGLERFHATGHGAVIGRRIEITGRRRDGTELPVELTPWAVGTGDNVRFNAFVADITKRKEFERQLRHQALHDTLTGLPNRALLLDRLGHALARGRRERLLTAVLFIDLDRFKTINDTYGHDGGDRLLLAVAERLRAALRPSDTVARLGGDEFVVVCEALGNRHEAVAIAERLIGAMRAPVTLQGTAVVVSASVGLAVTEGDTHDPEQLLGDADLAMYRAKERRTGVYELFDESMRLRLAERLSIETALRAAIPRGELTTHYQPIVSLADGRWTAFEALARWCHPERGMVPPSEFIPVAEETGLIADLGGHIMRVACAQLASWMGAHPQFADATMAINVSVHQIEQDDFVESVATLLARLRCSARHLVLEITESAVMKDEALMVSRLAELRELGVGLAIDDFGTGYSSLGRLSRLPVDSLKVDRSLVAEIDASTTGEALVSAAIAVAHSLGLRVVAEGVETPSQRDALAALGCDAAQGYLLGPPVAAEEIDAALASWPRLSGTGSP